jgi:DNA-directed RNA polymerase specialized sigma24 family protein
VTGVTDVEQAVDTGFEAFVARVERPLRHILVARLGVERGREATAEALAWAYEHWQEAQGLDAPVGYLARVGTSRTRPRKRRLLPVAGTPPKHEPEPKLLGVLRALPERQRVAVVLVHGYQWSVVEVGAELGISSSAVKTHLRRGLARIRNEMGVEA